MVNKKKKEQSGVLLIDTKTKILPLEEYWEFLVLKGEGARAIPDFLFLEEKYVCN